MTIQLTIKIEKKHLFYLGILLITSIIFNVVIASTSTNPLPQGHPLSQTWIDTDINMGPYNITTSGTIKSTNDGFELPDGTTLKNSEDLGTGVIPFTSGGGATTPCNTYCSNAGGTCWGSILLHGGSWSADDVSAWSCTSTRPAVFGDYNYCYCYK